MSNLREFRTDVDDFRSFVELFYRTDYSHRLNQISDKIPSSCVAPPEEQYLPPFFSDYCSMLQYHGHKYLTFSDDSGKAVAGAAFTINDGYCELDSFYVLRSHQLKGFGRSFYHEFESYLRQKGVRGISLLCFFPGAKAFCGKMGFEVYGSEFFKFF